MSENAVMDPTDLEGTAEPTEEPAPDEIGPDPETNADSPTAPDAPAPDQEEPQGSQEPELVIDGTTGQLGWSVGGAKPTSSSLRLQGGKLDVEGQYAKGEVITLLVEAQVGEVAFIDRRASDGTVAATERRHKARIISVMRG